MKILFVGCFVPEVCEHYVPALSAAGNKFQNNCIKALKEKHDVKGLSFISLPVNCSLKDLEEEANSNNFKIIFAKNNRITSYIKFRKLLKEYLKWADCVVVYNVVYVWFNLPNIAKNKKTKSILILADYTPPVEENGLLRKIYSYLMQKEFKKYDKVITLSSKSNKYLSQNQIIQTVNGCINWSDFKNLKAPNLSNLINIVYSGALTKVAGIDLLIKGFLKTKNKKLRLIICGQGNEFNELIEDAVKSDDRIIFKGYVTRNEYMQILEQAHILINPRNMNLLQNENNFPSKILEYLASGRLILSTRFSGYEKYLDYIKFIDPDEIALYDAIEEVVSNENLKEVLNESFIKNREFAKLLDWKNQMNKFLI